MQDELRRQQEAQHDHDALCRFEHEGGRVTDRPDGWHYEATTSYEALPAVAVGGERTTGNLTIMERVRFEEGSIREFLDKDFIGVRDLSALALSADEAAAVAQLAISPVQEIQALKLELSADPLARAYRRLRNAVTGKQIRSARAAVRRATRHQMVHTMTQNSTDLASRPRLARAIAAEVVRKQMSTHG